MIKIVLLLIFIYTSVFANFFIMDKGKIIEIVNEPSENTQIVGSDGDILKKHKTIQSAREEQKSYISKTKETKAKSIDKKPMNSIENSKKVKKYSKIKKKSYKQRYQKYRKNKEYTTINKKGVKQRKSKKSLRKKYAKKIIRDLIVIRTSKRLLEFYKNGRWYKNYKIAVGKRGWRVYGTFKISKKVKWPKWIPTKRIRKENPRLPSIVYGGPKNPLGPRALYLGNSKVRIHGTNKPKSIGKAVSHGCFRMRNKDIIELYSMVKIGTPVYIK